MSVNIEFSNNDVDFEWLGKRLLNPAFDINYQGLPTDAIGFNPLFYYRYIPQNLEFRSDVRYRDSFLPDVNWTDAKGISDRIEHGESENPEKDWNQVSARQVDQGKITLALGQWSNVININNFNANITFAYADIGAGGPSGVTYLGADNSDIGGDNHKNDYVVFFNEERVGANPYADLGDLSLGTFGGYVAMHELGHVFGLFHGRDDSPFANLSDDLRNSILWYPESQTTRLALTPGMQDIQDLRAQYGESHAQDGNTTYTFTQNNVDLGHGTILDGVVGADLKNYVMTLSDPA